MADCGRTIRSCSAATMHDWRLSRKAAQYAEHGATFCTDAHLGRPWRFPSIDLTQSGKAMQKDCMKTQGLSRLHRQGSADSAQGKSGPSGSPIDLVGDLPHHRKAKDDAAAWLLPWQPAPEFLSGSQLQGHLLDIMPPCPLTACQSPSPLQHFSRFGQTAVLRVPLVWAGLAARGSLRGTLYSSIIQRATESLDIRH